MAGNKKDRGAKDEITQGMSQAGKDAATKAGKKEKGGKRGAGSDKVTRGMSKSGPGAGIGGTGGGSR